MFRSTRRASRVAILLALASSLLALPAPASAGEYAVPFCTANPTGASPGWKQTDTQGTSGGIPYFFHSTNCGLNGRGHYRRFEIYTVPAGATSDWTFYAPANTYVSRLDMDHTAVPRSGGAADALYAEFDNGSRTTLDMAVGNAGSTLGVSNYTLPATGPRATRIQASLFCQASSDNCAGIYDGQHGNEYTIRGGTVYLTDPTNPSISSPGGAGWQASPPDAANPVTYEVSDTGSGVREMRLYVDGILVESQASNCAANALVPCPLTASGTMTFDTRRLSEGEHEVALVAVDGSGNVTAQSERQLTVTVRRAPASSSTAPPTAGGDTGTGGGAPTAGTPVQGNPGTWSGTDLTFVYQWMRCDQNGQNCVPIAGANGLSYTPTSADVGRTLMFCVTASNSGGQTERCSAPTAVVAAPASSPVATTNDMPPTGTAGADGTSGRNGADGTSTVQRVNLTAVLSSRTTVQKVRYGKRVPITGRLLRPDGTPIAGARLSVQTQTQMPGAAMANAAEVVTDAEGRFRWVAPAGPSRLIRFGYRANLGDVSYVDTSDVRLLVMAGVTLKASPRKVRNKRATVFTGRVLGKPIAKRGVLVDLQVFYRKKWRTFAAPRTNRRGAYRFKYRFTAGAATWKFRARVRPGADYPYEQGLSGQRRVKVTR